MFIFDAGSKTCKVGSDLTRVRVPFDLPSTVDSQTKLVGDVNSSNNLFPIQYGVPVDLENMEYTSGSTPSTS